MKANLREPLARSEAQRSGTKRKGRRKKYNAKPYEQMQYPGQRVQIDVKVVPKACITDPELKLYQYTSIDEYPQYRIFGTYTEQSSYSSAGFLRKVVAAFRRKGVKVECVQTDNSFESTNRFANSRRDIPPRLKVPLNSLIFGTNSSGRAPPNTTAK